MKGRWLKLFTVCLVGLLSAFSLCQPALNWTRRFDGGGWDNGVCVATDAIGNSFVAIASDSVGHDIDVILTKYDPTGAEVWTQSYDQASGYDSPVKILLSPDGSVYVLADSYAGVTLDLNATLIKFAPDGTKLWVQSLGTGVGQVGSARDAVLDDQGNVYVIGRSELTTIQPRTELLTARINSDGTLVWTTTYKIGQSYLFDAFSVTYVKENATSADIVVSGLADLQSFLLSYKTDGTLSDNVAYSASDSQHKTFFNKLVLLPGGDFVACGNALFGTKWQVVLNRYHVAAGKLTLVWTTTYSFGSATDPPDYATHAAVDPAGNIVIAGWAMQPQGDRDYMILKFAPTGGAPLWTATFGESPGSAEELSDLAIDPISSAIYVTGRSKAAATADDYTTIKYDTNGVRQWVERFHGNDNRPLDDAAALALDPLGGATVTGGSYSANNDWDAVTVHYDDGTTVKPSNFQITLGVLGSGGLSDLFDSDDHYLAIKYNFAVPLPYAGDEVIITGSTSPGPISEIRFGLEGHVTGPSISQIIYLRDFQASTWVPVSTTTPTGNDLLVVGTSSNPSRFVDANGQVQAKISYKIAGPRPNPGLDVFIDRAVWRIVR